MAIASLSSHPDRPMLAGVICGVAAGALWGLVFLAPELAGGFNPLELTIGRYLVYGSVAALLIGRRWRTLFARVGRDGLVALIWLALTGNTAYFILLSAAVQNGGAAMASLVLGFVPVAVTIVGSRDRGALPLRRLAPSILFCLAGAVCIGWDAFGALAHGGGAQAFGLLCAIGALALWTVYAIGNSRWLSRLGDVSPHDWNLMIGVVTGAQAIMLIPFALIFNSGAHSGAGWAQFAGVSIGVALFASIAGNALWNRASRLLPLTMVGQMILFETLFALIYAFMWEQRLPTPLETLAFAMLTLSLTTCIAAHRKPGARPAAAITPP